MKTEKKKGKVFPGKPPVSAARKNGLRLIGEVRPVDPQRSKSGHSRLSVACNQRRKRISSLTLASQLTKEASRLGFDWPDLSGVLNKLEEELREFKEALSLQNRGRIQEELGDLLFALVNVSRFLRVDPEDALRKTVTKFMVRFHYIETSLRRKGRSFDQSNLNEMDQLWEEAKKKKR
jgi:tetrapyrrole methylase family protein/MazG family protein